MYVLNHVYVSHLTSLLKLINCLSDNDIMLHTKKLCKLIQYITELISLLNYYLNFVEIIKFSNPSIYLTSLTLLRADAIDHQLASLLSGCVMHKNWTWYRYICILCHGVLEIYLDNPVYMYVYIYNNYFK